jgi:hypothetical protein
VDAWVTLHQVTTAGGGPIDSVRSDRTGRFRLRVASGDSTALYMVSAAYRGITYFTEAMLARRWQDTLPPLEVFDTSSVAPEIGVSQRHMVVRLPGEGGRRSVLELITLINRGDRTRISPDSTTPVWVGRLPGRAEAFQVGEGEITAPAVVKRGDSLIVTGPVPPGTRQVMYTYTLPGDHQLAVPLDQPVDRFLVLLEDTAAVLMAGPLERRGIEVFDDIPFAMFDGAVPPDARQAVFQLARTGLRPETLAIGIAALAGVVLLLAIPLIRRRRVLVPVGVALETPQALAHRIAALDAAFEAGDRSPASETAYRERRAALKSRLAELLGTRGS